MTIHEVYLKMFTGRNTFDDIAFMKNLYTELCKIKNESV